MTDAPAPLSTRRLVGSLFWPVLVLGIPPTLAGLFFGIAAMTEHSIAGLAILTPTVLGLALLWGYYRAYTHRPVPIRWDAFWLTSAAFNAVALALSLWLALTSLRAGDWGGGAAVLPFCAWAFWAASASAVLARRAPLALPADADDLGDLDLDDADLDLA